MRKRTIAARVERLWGLAPFEREYVTRGHQYAFYHDGRYVLNRNVTHADHLARMARQRPDMGATGAFAMQHLYGHEWGDAHEYAHGWDYNKQLRRTTGKGRFSGSWEFNDAVIEDGRRAIRPNYSDLTHLRGMVELFADTIASTIVNDHTFLREHPAKYAYARTLLKENEVI